MKVPIIEDPIQFKAELRIHMYEPNGDICIKTINGIVTHRESTVIKIPPIFDYENAIIENKYKVTNKYTFENTEII